MVAASLRDFRCPKRLLARGIGAEGLRNRPHVQDGLNRAVLDPVGNNIQIHVADSRERNQGRDDGRTQLSHLGMQLQGLS